MPDVTLVSKDPQDTSGHQTILSAESSPTWIKMPPETNYWQPLVLEIMLLSVASLWKLRMDKNVQINLIYKNFQQEDILAALRKVKKCPDCDPVVGKITQRVWEKDKTAIAAQAKDLV